MKPKLILAVWLLIAASAFVSAAPITLVDGGRAQAVIVVPHGSTSASAAELRDYI